MSIDALAKAIGGLPKGMREEIMDLARTAEVKLSRVSDQDEMGYAKSMSQRTDDLGIDYEIDQGIVNQVVFLIGIKKFFSIVSSTFWVLDKFGKMAKKGQINYIKIGSHNIFVDDEGYRALTKLENNLRIILDKKGIYDFMFRYSYSDMIEKLVNKRKRRIYPIIVAIQNFVGEHEKALNIANMAWPKIFELGLL